MKEKLEGLGKLNSDTLYDHLYVCFSVLSKAQGSNNQICSTRDWKRSTTTFMN